ncbi:MAG: hypothetical protein CMD54_00585 [Gammaproteobacteria bacterium]|nr:hypothetical protein [Gammaproteobacteria bacterium]HAN79983.1 hypothetical protein [Gammaproteobacteria bacterium]
MVELDSLGGTNTRAQGTESIFHIQRVFRATWIPGSFGCIKLWIQIREEIQTVSKLPLDFYNLILVGLKCRRTGHLIRRDIS